MRVLWVTLVGISFAFLLGYFIHVVFQDKRVATTSPDPLEVLLQQPAESLPRPAETGSGQFADKKVEEPPAAHEEARNPSSEEKLPSNMAIQTAFFPKPSSDDKKEVDLAQKQKESAAQLESIERELSQLPGGPESAPARTMLLHTASALELDDAGLDQVRELAIDELLLGQTDEVAGAAQSSSFTYFLPVLAHDVALKAALDGDDAMNMTIDGLTAHRDPGVRYSMVRQFISRYPNLEPQLREQLYYRNIATDLQTNTAP